MLSVIIPAHNEAALIGRCLQAVLSASGDMPVEIIVAANGCDDETVSIAQSYQMQTKALGWKLTVLDLPKGGKLGALNAADEVARGEQRLYLDADVLISTALLDQIHAMLECSQPRYASGTLIIPRPNSFVSRAYRATYQKVPFMQKGVPGAGVFAMNTAGRARWGEWPDIISDDTFARLQFSAEERFKVKATYQWPLVEGWKNLVAVRRRQNAGVDEIREKYPELLANDEIPNMGLFGKLKLAALNPVGFAVYAGVALAVRLTQPKGRGDWRRGR